MRAPGRPDARPRYLRGLPRRGLRGRRLREWRLKVAGLQVSGLEAAGAPCPRSVPGRGGGARSLRPPPQPKEASRWGSRPPRTCLPLLLRAGEGKSD